MIPALKISEIMPPDSICVLNIKNDLSSQKLKTAASSNVMRYQEKQPSKALYLHNRLAK
jgi:hypothetical protein